jgi:hypothetical protein
VRHDGWFVPGRGIGSGDLTFRLYHRRALQRFLADEEFEAIVERDLRDGQHRNPGERSGWFTTAYFHRPAQLREEAEEAGLLVDGLFGIEGPAWTIPDLGAWLENPARRAKLFAALRRVETEPDLLGASAHLLLVGRA